MGYCLLGYPRNHRVYITAMTQRPRLCTASRSPHGRRLRVEPLEDRRLLSVEPFPGNFAPVEPLGSLIYEASASGELDAGMQFDNYTLDLEADQTISIVIDPSPSLGLLVSLQDPDGKSIASGMDRSGVDGVVIQTVPISESGVYTLAIGSRPQTTGTYTARVILNAAVEMESYDGQTNDTLATAVALNTSFIPLDTETADRGAVLGTLPIDTTDTDWYRFDLTDGQSATLALTTDTFADVKLELHAADGTLLAQGVSASNISQVINNFVDQTTDATPTTYYARVTGQSADYSLVVTRDADFDTERNAEIPQDLPSGGTAIGHLSHDSGIGYESITEYKLSAGNTAESQYFGISVSISGDTAIVGSWSGSAYVYRFVGNEWQQVQELTAPGGTDVEGFGQVVAISGQYAVVGARTSAFVFRFDGSQWIQQQELVPTGLNHLWGYGESVAIDDDVVFLGGTTDWTDNLWTFRFDGETWKEEQVLRWNRERAGLRIEITGDVAIVSSLEDKTRATRSRISINAYDWGYTRILRYDGDQWIEEQNLGRLGSSVTIDNDIAIVGATWEHSYSGAVYVFRFDGAEWVKEQELVASDASPDVHFGMSVALSNNTLLVGGTRMDYPRSAEKVYIFRFDGERWVETGKLAASDAAERDYFGENVALDGNTAIVGARLAGERSAGSAYIYTSLCQDDYAISLRGGEEFSVSTTTPSDEVREPINTLDPMVQLFDPSGTLVASDDNSAADGRNVKLSYTPSVSGQYMMRILSANDMPGEYVLNVEGYSGSAASFTATANDPQPNDLVGANLSQITIDFNDNLLIASLDAEDLTVGGVTATGVTVVDGDTVVFDVPDGLSDGLQTVAIAAGAIVDVQGSLIEAFSFPLRIDATPPVVTVEQWPSFKGSPRLFGRIDEPETPVDVSIGGNTYSAVNHGDGTWTLDDGIIDPPLAPDVYDVTVLAVDALGNVGTDSTTDELTVLAAPGFWGAAWHDMDGDGVHDEHEPGMPGVTVYLDLNHNGRFDGGEPNMVTWEDLPLTPEDETGNYYFAGLEPGSYVVGQVLPDGWQAKATQPVLDDDSGWSGSWGTEDISFDFNVWPGTWGINLAGGTARIATPPDDASDATGGTVHWHLTSGGNRVEIGEFYPSGNPVPQGTSFLTDAAADLIRLSELREDGRFGSLDGRGFATVILDTGIDRDHPFFGPDADGDGTADRIVYQYDFIDDDHRAADDDGHGTHVAGVIGSQDEEYPGMAPGADLIVLRVMSSEGAGDFGDVEEALRWIINNAHIYNIASVNMSLGDQENHSSPQRLYGIDDELNTLALMGVIVVSAAGNEYFEHDSQPGVAYPGADPNTISVGAVYTTTSGGYKYDDDEDENTPDPESYSTVPDQITPFSQRHASLTTILAPGGPVSGPEADGVAISFHGTSQAAAHITGIAAVAQQLAVEHLGRKLTPGEFKQLLRDTGVTVNDGDDEDDNVTHTGLNFPRVDVMGLVEGILAMGNVPDKHVLRIAPGEVIEKLDFANYSGIPITALGPVDYRQLDNVTPSTEGRWFWLDTTHDGTLTLVVESPAIGNVDLTLYDQIPAEGHIPQPLAASTLQDGTRRIDRSVVAGQSYYFRVRGSNEPVDVKVLNLVRQHGSLVSVAGSDFDEQITYSASEPDKLTVNGVAYQLNAAAIEEIRLDGGDGHDSITLYDSAGDDLFVGFEGGGVLQTPALKVAASDFEFVVAYATAGGDDLAKLYDSPGDDLYVTTPVYGGLTGDGFEVHTQGFDTVHAFATAGGNDTAKLYDSPGDDKFYANPTEAVLSGEGFYRRGKFFDAVHAYASNGGDDLAEFFDSPGNDTFWGTAIDGGIVTADYFQRAKYFENVHGYAGAGGYDVAKFYDSPGDDLFVATPTYGSLSGEGFHHHAHRFDGVHAYGTSGGYDVAKLYDSADDDLFYGDWREGALFNPGVYYNRAKWFEQVHAFAGKGGHDRAELYGSPGDDTFVTDADNGAMFGEFDGGFYNRAKFFEEVYGYASQEGHDEAYLNDSTQPDLLQAQGNWARLSNAALNFLFEASGFNKVHAKASSSDDTKEVPELGTLNFTLDLLGPWQDK